MGVSDPSITSGPGAGDPNPDQDVVAPRPTADEELRREHSLASAVLDTVGALVIVLDPDGRIVQFNRACERATGYPFEEASGRVFADFLLVPEEADGVRAVFERLTAGDFPNQHENFWVARDGTRRRIAWTNTALVDDQGAVEHIIGTGIDVTEHRQAEEAYRQAFEESRRRQAEVSALLAAVRAVLEHRSFETAARTIFGSCKELIGAAAGYVALLSSDSSRNEVAYLDPGTDQCAVDPSLPMPIRGMRARAYESGKTIYDNDFEHSEWTGLLPAGHTPLANVLFAPLVIEGQVGGLLGLGNKPGGFSDNDARLASAFAEFAAIALLNSRTLDSLEASVKEKEILIKEVHHRVKNNLQLIASMLNLQAGKLADERDLEPLRESQDRVRTLALIHEQLYSSKDLSRIPFRDYLQRLTDYLVRAHASGQRRITSRLDVDDTLLAIDTAIPVALMVAELVTNSMTHAFPDGRDGQIGLEFRRVEGDAFQLAVWDDGTGFPDDLDFRATNSLGLQLVSNLVRQIEGRIELDRSAGTRFVVAFRDSTSSAL